MRHLRFRQVYRTIPSTTRTRQERQLREAITTTTIPPITTNTITVMIYRPGVTQTCTCTKWSYVRTIDIGVRNRAMHAKLLNQCFGPISSVSVCKITALSGGKFLTETILYLHNSYLPLWEVIGCDVKYLSAQRHTFESKNDVNFTQKNNDVTMDTYPQGKKTL